MNDFSLMVIYVKYDLSETCHLFFSTLSTPTRLGILELLRESPRNVKRTLLKINPGKSNRENIIPKGDEGRR